LERGVQVRVPIEADADGYLDKECPSDECMAAFKIHEDDWTDLVSDDVAYCPVCRFAADAEQWFTTEQVKYAERVAFAQFARELDRTISTSVRRANARLPKGGLVSIKLDYRPGRHPVLVPVVAAEILEQRSACEVCGCRYAAVGAAFFCPACGHNSALSTFSETIATIRQTIEVLPKLAELVGREPAAGLGRHLTETSLGKLVTAFERLAEASYNALPDPKKRPGRNAFQRLDDGSRLFVGANGPSYEAILGSADLAALRVQVQRRHVLTHNDGIVDQDYLDRSGDTTYRLGQRVVIQPKSVLRATDLIERLAAGLRPGP
jgi:Zn ribbon nucleic-acid-binding protein